MTNDELLVWGFVQGAWWFALFVACAVAAAEVASAKGNSGAAGLLGLLFGPFGLLIAWATPGNAREAERKLILRGERRRCSVCAEIVRAKAVKCRYCGDELPPLPPTPEHAVPRLTQASLAGWPSAPKLPALTRKDIALVAAVIGAAVVIAAAVAAYNAGYRFVTPAEWWRAIHQ